MKQLLKSTFMNVLWKAVAVKRRIERPTVVAVTGSVGKTSTKEALAAVLATTGRTVVKTYGNLNTETGVALSLLGFKHSPQNLFQWLTVFFRCLVPPVKPYIKPPIWVLEFSADHPGDIAFLSRQFSLDIAILTAIVPVHMGSYKDLDELATEKFSITAGLKPGGTLILNADDPVQVERAKKLGDLQIVWYGIADALPKRQGLWATKLAYKDASLVADIQSVMPKRVDGLAGAGIPSMRVHTKLLGKHQLGGLLAAATAGMLLKAPADKILKVLQEYDLPAGRGRILEGGKEMLLIDGSYNASPEIVKWDLDMLKTIAGDRRVVAVLGNMNELGDMAAKAHAEVGTHAAGKVDFLVAIGPNGKAMAKAAVEAGQPKHTVMAFPDTESVVHKIDQIVKRKDLVYIKGSQNGVFLERLVKRLMAHPDQAEKLLVRQSRYWYDKYSR